MTRTPTVKILRFSFLLLLAALLLLSGCEKSAEAVATEAPLRGEYPETDHGTPVFVNAVCAPQEGDDPLTLSGVENVLRISYVLQHEENYSLEGHGTVKTKVAFISYSQDVEVYKDYRLGVLLEVDITESTVKNDAWQTCYVEDTAMLRGAANGKSTWDGRNTEWKDRDPDLFSREDYRKKYGLFGFELTNYVLNEDTVDSWTDAADNGDGTYTQTIYPNLTAATGDVIRRMRTMGGLDKDPVFKEAAITLTFDANWRILSIHLDETYSIKLGVIKSDGCRAETDYVYTYENADISDYSRFFAWYFEE